MGSKQRGEEHDKQNKNQSEKDKKRKNEHSSVELVSIESKNADHQVGIGRCDAGSYPGWTNRPIQNILRLENIVTMFLRRVIA